ncbi:MAG: rRNA maturation RNAse YbeY, partial [Actinomycetota bacterium]|nr:rRNA maturation RNAse YbeY [Actinomycetota bacterium]
MPDLPRPKLNVPKRVGGDGHPEVFCADEQRDLPVNLERWQSLATAVLLEEGVRGLAELALLFVSEHEMAELNELHMGKPGATDVLAFPIDAAEAEMVLHGQPTSRFNALPDFRPFSASDVARGLLIRDSAISATAAKISTISSTKMTI